MKARYVVSILILIILTAMVGILFTAQNDSFAFAADGLVTLKEVTQKNIYNDDVAFDTTLGQYGRGVKFTFETSAPKYSFIIYQKSSGVFTKLYESNGNTVVNGGFTIIPSQSGELRLDVTVESNHEVVLDSYSCEFKSDCVAPYEPTVDLTTLNEYHIAPFNLKYQLSLDIHSGIDFSKSYYYAKNSNNQYIIPQTLIPSYKELQIAGISDNCTITFALYDNVGNYSLFSYSYDKYGLPESEEPTITVTPVSDWAKEVKVTVSWGQEYDVNPYARKYYSVSSASLTPIKTAYKKEIIVNEENCVFTAYYYKDGEEKTTSVDISNVDKTAPKASTLQETFNVSIDLTESKYLSVSVKAVDYGSGIKSVYDNYGNVYTAGEKNYYNVEISGIHTFSVYAEDCAGNKASYGYSNPALDFALMNEYHEKYTKLNKERYSSEGWNKVVSSFNALSKYLLDDKATSSHIYELKNAVQDAIDGEILCTARFSSVPEGLTDFKILSGLQNTDALIGDTVRIVVGKVLKTDDVINANINSAIEKSGFSESNVYKFTISLEKKDGSALTISGNLGFGFKVSGAFTAAKVYCLNASGDMMDLPIEIDENGVINAYANEFGDFYVVTKPLVEEKPQEVGITIGNNFYSWKIIVVTIAIILGVAAVAFVIVYFTTKRRR